MGDKLEQIDYKYKILQKIGIGGQSNIFIVEEKDTNIIYVAKVPKKEKDSQFRTEINILNTVFDEIEWKRIEQALQIFPKKFIIVMMK